jgi:copper homeostasis protein
LKQDILLCKDLDCKGIVSGVLDNHQMIDVARTKTLLELSKPLDFTFHRAFDWVSDPKQALKHLMDLKVKRVLTSGQELSAEKGMSLLKDLREQSKGDLTVLPGGGVNPNNVLLFKEAGFSEIHVSATTVKTVISPPKVLMNNVKVFDESIKSYSDITIIQELLKQF